MIFKKASKELSNSSFDQNPRSLAQAKRLFTVTTLTDINWHNLSQSALSIKRSSCFDVEHIGRDNLTSAKKPGPNYKGNVTSTFLLSLPLSLLTLLQTSLLHLPDVLHHQLEQAEIVAARLWILSVDFQRYVPSASESGEDGVSSS